jgi:hypothetical protein
MILKDRYHDYTLNGLGVTTAEAIVFDIVSDLTDRRGLRQEWDNIDDDIQEEIIKKWVYIVEYKMLGKK